MYGYELAYACCLLPAAGCWVLGAGCWVLGAGCWLLGGLYIALPSCLAAWLPGCLAAWLPGCLATCCCCSQKHRVPVQLLGLRWRRPPYRRGASNLLLTSKEGNLCLWCMQATFALAAPLLVAYASNFCLGPFAFGYCNAQAKGIGLPKAREAKGAQRKTNLCKFCLKVTSDLWLWV